MTIHCLIAALILGGGLPGTRLPPSSLRGSSAVSVSGSRRPRSGGSTRSAGLSGVREAIRLAGKHGRPVFLFTHDGHMNVGRC